MEEIILHALKAIRDSLPADSALTAQNCSFGFLSKDKAFDVIDDEVKIQSFLDKLPAVISQSVVKSETIEEVVVQPEETETTAMDVDPSPSTGSNPTEENDN